MLTALLIRPKAVRRYPVIYNLHGNGGKSTFYKDSFDGKFPIETMFINKTYIELEGLGHQRTEMIARLEPIWFDYHMESLRRAAPKAGNSGKE